MHLAKEGKDDFRREEWRERGRASPLSMDGGQWGYRLNLICDTESQKELIISSEREGGQKVTGGVKGHSFCPLHVQCKMRSFM